VQRVVTTALALARQPALTPGPEPDTWVVPSLTGSWSRATIGLEHPARPELRRPITFDHDVARDRTDVVLGHLGHPLLRMSLALMRAEVWGTGTTCIASPSATPTRGSAPLSRSCTVGSWSRALRVTGCTSRLIFAGLRLGGERPERLGVEATDAALALAGERPVPATLRDQLMPGCRRPRRPLRAALQARAGDRARQLTATLAARGSDEQAHVHAS